MKGAIEDNLEASIELLSKITLDGELSDEQIDVLNNIPVVKNIVAITQLYRSIREVSTVKKITKFIETLQKSGVDKSQYEKLRERYGDERILEEVLFRIDRMRTTIHVEIQANLYKSLLEEKIDWNRFVQICDAVEQLSAVDIDKEDGLGNPGSSFIASGLAYVYYHNNIPPKIARNGKLYNDFWDYGLKPLKDEKRSKSEEGLST